MNTDNHPLPTEAEHGIPSPEVLVERARQMVPLLRSMGRSHDENGRVSDSAMALLREAGFFRIVQPRSSGGFGMHLRVLWAVAREVTRADTATGWILCLAGVHPWLVGMFPPEAQDEVFHQGCDAVVPVLSGGVGRDVVVRPTAHGYAVSGRWLYASGIEVADWVCVMIPAPATDDDAAHQRLALVPRTAFEVDQQSWRVASMRGTGSKDVRLSDVAIPAHRTISWPDAQVGVYPGSVRNTGAMYRLPLNAVFALSTAMGVVGGSYGLMDAVVDVGRKRIANASQAPQGNDTFSQAELGQCASMVHMAYQLLISDVDEMFAQAAQGIEFTQEQRARYRADAATAARTAVAATERIVVTCGGALLPEGELERAFRDVHGMASHFLLQPQVGGELYGKALYGVAIPSSVRL